jgi:glycosyltransferase involved in cell wall biosynthesis
VHCVYHGLNADFARLVEHQSERTAANGSLRVVSAGRLVAKKGFDVLAEACGLLAAQNVSVDAVIAGPPGEHTAEVERIVAARGLTGRVHLPGSVSQSELHAAYMDADVFCLPCRVLDNGDRDGIPNVMVEAMAAGLPVVTTPVSGIPELVSDGENGLLVPPNDPTALAGALLRLRREPDLAARLGRAARATVRERFDGEASAGRLAELFAEPAR